MKNFCTLRRLIISRQFSFVPKSKPVQEYEIAQLQDFLQGSKRLLILTGAGLSTESGIPDYRSEGVGLYARTNRRPIQYQDFVKSETNRQRYWARNYAGWAQFAGFQPNICHDILSKWESLGRIHWLVTQNVDALHSKAGSQKLTELHGCTHRVVCLSCDILMSRWDLQTMFQDLNPNWNIKSDALAPDGDVILTDEQVKDFKVPPCPNCYGILKPDVIFFGDNVPKPIVDFVYGKVDESDRFLIVGSSLYVYSGYRFVARASERGIPIAIVNIGETRADKLADFKIEARCGDLLPKINL